MGKFLGCAGVAFGLMLLVGLIGVTFYFGNINGLRTADEACSEKLSEIDNQLERKAKLVPNLVATVKGYASHETKAIQMVTDAHKNMLSAKTTEERVEANNGLQSALGRLMMFTEAYPELKADKQFIKLQDQLEGTENRITVARMDYNAKVKILNQKLRTYPAAWFKDLAGVEKRQYFETTEDVRANNLEVKF